MSDTDGDGGVPLDHSGLLGRLNVGLEQVSAEHDLGAALLDASPALQPTSNDDSSDVVLFATADAVVSPHEAADEPLTIPAAWTQHEFPNFPAPLGMLGNLPPSDDLDGGASPVQLVNPNPNVLGSGNLDLTEFLRLWAYQAYLMPTELPQPRLDKVLEQCRAKPLRVQYCDLRGDEYDFQGLDWTAMGTTRRAARSRRRRKHQNHTNREGSDQIRPGLGDRTVSSRESFFRFERMNLRSDVKLAHFQLRNVLACPTRSEAYYPGPQGIHKMDLVSQKTELVMKMNEFSSLGSPVTTLDADHGILFCGTFSGEYYLQPLASQGNRSFAEGQITPNANGITNHLKIHTTRRSSQPVAAIASNDSGYRVMDIGSQKLISEFEYSFALNCSAICPDRRLRIMVGDSPESLITCADTGQVLQRLEGHRDYGFACDWCEDGWTVATAAQDMCIKIWDARRFCNSIGKSTPLCTLRTEIGAARSLHFSPSCSGPMVLVAVEEADCVNIFDARTFEAKQTIDMFGEMGGAAFANDGEDLNVLCGDSTRGGLLQFKRCGQSINLDPEMLGYDARSTPFAWRQGPAGTEWRPHSRRLDTVDLARRRSRIQEGIPIF